MNHIRVQPRMIVVGLVLVVLLIVPAVALAQDEDPVCNPAAERLAEVMELDDCGRLLELQAEGYGLGEIMKAWYLAEDLEGFGEWEELLARKQEEGLGWGQFKMASRLAGEDGDAEALLELKQSGIGWGQIKKAQAMDAAGIMGFDEALSRFQEGASWDDIRAELGLEDGPPPWAGPKDKQTGPPPWANNDKDKGKNKDD